MFSEEAQWLEKAIHKIKPGSNNEVANLGSSGDYFRKKVQPHINSNIIIPLQNNGWRVIHIDQKKEDGVDIIADLTQPEFGLNFNNRFALTICTNMLEHVENINIAVANPLAVTHVHGFILITVPYKYKIHHDPIDNGFRPTPAEVFQLFPAGSVHVKDEAIISINDISCYKIKKSAFPLWGHRERIKFYFGKRYKVSGILLQVIGKTG